jgi:5-deoxy-glucuronate isomerase
MSPTDAGWSHISFRTQRVEEGASSTHATGEFEVGLVPLAGTIHVRALDQEWRVGGRTSVFGGLPEALYLPAGSDYEIQALGGPADVAVCGARASEQHEPRLVTSSDYDVELRGAGNASRQVATLLPPDFAAQRLLLVEVWTPAGNWSSYPPHKHDEDRAPDEIVLEETFFFCLSDPRGFGLTRLYSPERDFDSAMVVRDRDLLCVPWGYHTTVAVPGYDMYYLNVLAGETRALTAFEDPDHTWVRGTWPEQERDARLPLVTA